MRHELEMKEMLSTEGAGRLEASKRQAHRSPRPRRKHGYVCPSDYSPSNDRCEADKGQKAFRTKSQKRPARVSVPCILSWSFSRTLTLCR